MMLLWCHIILLSCAVILNFFHCARYVLHLYSLLTYSALFSLFGTLFSFLVSIWCTFWLVKASLLGFWRGADIPLRNTGIEYQHTRSTRS
jgi:hypothetical protein